MLAAACQSDPESSEGTEGTEGTEGSEGTEGTEGSGGTEARLVEVSIGEVAPYTSAVGERAVRLSIELAEPPRCADDFTVGFLIDVDSDPSTGAAEPPFNGLGADAMISVGCVNDELASTLGALTVDGTTVHLDTTVAQLPAVEFRFVAFVAEGDTFERIPAAPDSAAWAILERRTP